MNPAALRRAIVGLSDRRVVAAPDGLLLVEVLVQAFTDQAIEPRQDIRADHATEEMEAKLDADDYFASEGYRPLCHVLGINPETVRAWSLGEHADEFAMWERWIAA